MAIIFLQLITLEEDHGTTQVWMSISLTSGQVWPARYLRNSNAAKGRIRSLLSDSSISHLCDSSTKSWTKSKQLHAKCGKPSLWPPQNNVGIEDLNVNLGFMLIQKKYEEHCHIAH